MAANQKPENLSEGRGDGNKNCPAMGFSIRWAGSVARTEHKPAPLVGLEPVV